MKRTWQVRFQPDTYLNSNQRLHHHKKAPITKRWREAAKKAAVTHSLPILDRAHIVITFTFADKRRRDVGNLYPTAKAIVDGLVDARVLPDDDDAHLLGPDLRRGHHDARSNPAGVMVEITRLDGAA